MHGHATQIDLGGITLNCRIEMVANAVINDHLTIDNNKPQGTPRKNLVVLARRGRLRKGIDKTNEKFAL